MTQVIHTAESEFASGAYLESAGATLSAQYVELYEERARHQHWPGQMAALSTRLIQDSDDCNFFGSSRQEIDDWLSAHAKRQHAEKRVVTYVWEDQGNICGYFSLTPHRLTDVDVSVSGHAGGPLTGYLIAKIGIWTGAANQTEDFTTSNGDVVAVPKPVLLIVDALVAASKASRAGGGRYLFIDTTDEPTALLEALQLAGFKSINPAGSPTHYIMLRWKAAVAQGSDML
jgi:hypothetical protein